MGDVLVRPARMADIDALIALFVAVADERLWLGTEPGFDQDRFRAGLRRRIEGGTELVLVAERDGAIVGSIRVDEDEEDGHELGMLVAADARGSGIGSALLDAAVSWCAARAIARLCLYVYPHNAVARRLYDKHAFRETHRFAKLSKRQSGEVWDVIRMERAIAPADAAPS